MADGQQHHCFHGGSDGGYVHTLEDGRPLTGTAYFDRLFADVLKYGLATKEEAEEARSNLDDREFEDYYFARGTDQPKSHEEAMQAVRA